MFRGFIFLSLVGAYLFLTPSWNEGEIILLGILYLVFLWWRDWFYQGYDPLSDFKLDRLKTDRPLHFVFGSIIESEEAENREKILFKDGELEKKNRNSVFFFSGLVVVVVSAIFYRFGSNSLHVSALFVVLLMAPIPRASHLAVQLVSIFGGAIAALLGVWRQDEINPVAILFFVVGTMGALICYQAIRMQQDAFKNLKFSKGIFKKTLFASGAFLILLFMSLRLFPEHKTAKPQSRSAHGLASAQDKVLTEIAKQAAKFESSREQSKNSDSTKSPLRSSAKESSSNTGAPYKEEDKQTASQNSQQSQKSGQSTMVSPPSGAEKTPGSQARVSGGADQQGASASAQSNSSDLGKRQEEIKKELEFQVEKLTALLKALFWVGLAILLLRYFLRKKKVSPNEIRKLTRAEIKGFHQDLLRIQKAKLRPEQEIIETYNVMLKVFDLVEMGRAECVPAQIFVTQVSTKLPGLKNSLWTTTLCFEDVLYGENLPKPQSLKEFRRSAKTVFRGFNIDFRVE
jgi:hypothetical protein